MATAREPGWVSVTEFCARESLQPRDALHLALNSGVFVYADRWTVEWGHWWNQEHPNDDGRDWKWGDRAFTGDLGPRFVTTGTTQVTGHYRISLTHADCETLVNNEALSGFEIYRPPSHRSGDQLSGRVLNPAQLSVTASDLWLDTVSQNAVLDELKPLPMAIQQPLTAVEARHIGQLLDGTHKRVAPELRAVLHAWLHTVALPDAEVSGTDMAEWIRLRAKQLGLAESGEGLVRRLGIVGGQESKKRSGKGPKQ